MMNRLGLKVTTTTGGGATHFWAYNTEEERTESARRLQGLGHIADVSLCDVRSLRWATPNRQEIQTGLKVFDKQFQCIPGGNLIANTFLGQHIRPWSEVQCNGFTFKPGELQSADLKCFAQIDPQRYLARIVKNHKHFESESGWLTAVFHWTGPAARRTCEVHGAVLTDKHRNLIARIDADQIGRRQRLASVKVMDAVTPFLTQEVATNVRPFGLH